MIKINLFFLMLFLSFSGNADVCNTEYTNVGDCNGAGGIFCKEGDVNVCHCKFNSSTSVDCVINTPQTIDINSNKQIDLSNGFIYFNSLSIPSGSQLWFLSSGGMNNQLHLAGSGGKGGKGGGSIGKAGGKGGVGGGIGSGGTAGSKGGYSGRGGAGGSDDAIPGASIGIIITENFNLEGILSVSGEGGDGGIDATKGPGGGGGGAGGAGGGLLVVKAGNYSGDGNILASGGRGGNGGDGNHRFLSSHSGGGGGGGGGGDGGLLYLEGDGVDYLHSVSAGAGGSGGDEGAKSAGDGKDGSSGEPGTFFGTGVWDLSYFENIGLTALDFEIEVNLSKFWDWPDDFKNSILDQARLSKSWMRGYNYQTTFKNDLGNTVLDVKRVYAPVMFYADFTASVNLAGIIDTTPPFEEHDELITNYQGVSSGTMLNLETNITTYFYEDPVTKTIKNEYDKDIYAESNSISVNYRLDGSEANVRRETIFDKKNLIMGYKGSMSKELFNVNPSYTNLIDKIKVYDSGQLKYIESYIYHVLDLETGNTNSFDFFTENVKVGVKHPITKDWVVSCDFPSDCSDSTEGDVLVTPATPYGFTYSVETSNNDFKCLRSSKYLDISMTVVECDVELGRSLPKRFLPVIKRNEKQFDSNGDGTLDKMIYSEVLEYNEFGKPVKVKNEGGAISNMAYNERGKIYKKWSEGITTSENPTSELIFDGFGRVIEHHKSSFKYPSKFFYDEKSLLTKTTSRKDSFDSPSVIKEYDFSTTPSKTIFEQKIKEGLYSKTIEFADSNGRVLQKQELISGDEYIVKHVAFEDGVLSKEYDPLKLSTSGEYVTEAEIVNSGTDHVSYEYSEDPLQRLLRITYQDGGVKSYEYDTIPIPGQNGLYFPRATTIYPNGVRARYTFDLLDTVMIAEYNYDDNSGKYLSNITKEKGLNVTHLIDSFGRITSVFQDSIGNVLSKEHFDSGGIGVVYDDLLRIKATTNLELSKQIKSYYRPLTNELEGVTMDK